MKAPKTALKNKVSNIVSPSWESRHPLFHAQQPARPKEGTKYNDFTNFCDCFEPSTFQSLTFESHIPKSQNLIFPQKNCGKKFGKFLKRFPSFKV